MLIICAFSCGWAWACASGWYSFFQISFFSQISKGGLGLKAGLSVGRELAVGVGAEFCEGGGGEAAEGEHLLLGVDGDLDMVGGGGGRGRVSVPPHVDVPVAPRLLEVEGFQLVDLILYACDLSLDLLLLLQQLLHCCPGLLPFMTHLNIIRSAHPRFNKPTPPLRSRPPPSPSAPPAPPPPLWPTWRANCL